MVAEIFILWCKSHVSFSVLIKVIMSYMTDIMSYSLQKISALVFAFNDTWFNEQSVSEELFSTLV